MSECLLSLKTKMRDNFSLLNFLKTWNSPIQQDITILGHKSANLLQTALNSGLSASRLSVAKLLKLFSKKTGCLTYAYLEHAVQVSSSILSLDCQVLESAQNLGVKFVKRGSGSFPESVEESVVTEFACTK